MTMFKVRNSTDRKAEVQRCSSDNACIQCIGDSPHCLSTDFSETFRPVEKIVRASAGRLPLLKPDVAVFDNCAGIQRGEQE